uniref:Uncharacterized protein n=1 Tax=Cacopsylla melanoneura TaxID=428564 RepID=A0A8D9FAU9_9HEMI
MPEKIPSDFARKSFSFIFLSLLAFLSFIFNFSSLLITLAYILLFFSLDLDLFPIFLCNIFLVLSCSFLFVFLPPSSFISLLFLSFSFLFLSHPHLMCLVSRVHVIFSHFLAIRIQKSKQKIK